MASEKVSVKVIANDHDDVGKFHVHPRMYLGNQRNDYSQLKQKYHQMKVFPNNQVSLKDVKVVTGHDNFHLLFSMDYRKGRKNETWAVKTKIGRTLSGLFLKREIAQLATALAASDNDKTI